MTLVKLQRQQNKTEVTCLEKEGALIGTEERQGEHCSDSMHYKNV